MNVIVILKANTAGQRQKAGSNFKTHMWWRRGCQLLAGLQMLPSRIQSGGTYQAIKDIALVTKSYNIFTVLHTHTGAWFDFEDEVGAS